MPAAKRRRRHVRAKELPDAQTLSLLLGPANSSAFESHGAARAAWFEHRDYLMERLTGPFVRPWGFWEFEGGARHPRLAHAKDVLLELGLPLTAREIAIIRREKPE